MKKYLEMFLRSLNMRHFNWKMPRHIKWFPHVHVFQIKATQEEIWIECRCKEQMDIPEDRLEEAYEKLRNRDYTWDIRKE